jgi:hypothetical protein
MKLNKKELPLNNKIVWITLITPGFINYAQNFFKTLKLNKIDFKVIVFCTSTQCMEALKEFPSAKCVVLDTNYKQETLIYGEADYRKAVFQKLDLMSYILNLISEDKEFEGLGFIDTDVIMLKDISVLFHDYLQQYKEIDIFAQCDEGSEECSNHQNCVWLNTGCIVFRNKLSLDKFFKYTEKDIEENKGNQGFFCNLLKKYKDVKHLTISKQILLNGKNKYVRRHSNDLPSNAHLLHFNYMSNLDKPANMKKRGVWVV